MAATATKESSLTCSICEHFIKSPMSASRGLCSHFVKNVYGEAAGCDKFQTAKPRVRHGKERALQIKTPSGWKIAGKLLSIRGDWSFYREVSKGTHAFHQFDAWSVQAVLLPVLEADNVKWFYQYDKQAGQMSRISLKEFRAKAVERDFGEGKQFYVSTKYFKPIKMGPIKKWIDRVELVA